MIDFNAAESLPQGIGRFAPRGGRADVIHRWDERGGHLHFAGRRELGQLHDGVGERGDDFIRP